MSDFPVGTYLELVRPIMDDSRNELQERVNEAVKLAYYRTGQELIVGANLGKYISVGVVDCNPGYESQLEETNRKLDLSPHNKDVRASVKSYYKPTDLVESGEIAEVVRLINFADFLDTRHLLKIARKEAHAQLPAVRATKLIVLANMASTPEPSEVNLNLLTYLGVRIARKVPFINLGPVEARWKKPPHAMPNSRAA